MDFARSREEFKGLNPGDEVLALERTEAFELIVRPVLDEIDRQRTMPRHGDLSKKKRGTAPRFTATDFFRFQVLRVVIGKHSIKDTRNWLSSDLARRTRRTLGFDIARPHYGGKPAQHTPGIPSEGWISRFGRQWLPLEQFLVLMLECRNELLHEKLSLPDMLEELRTIYVDGSICEIHGTPPKFKDAKGPNGEDLKGPDGRNLKVQTNVGRVTAPDAGFISKNSAPEHHSGSGYNVIACQTIKGTVLGYVVVPLHDSENRTLESLIPTVARTLDRYPSRLRVLSADGGFNGPGVRRQAREHRMIENIHAVSHGHHDTAKDNAAKANAKRYEIEGHPNWWMNGHREFFCKCGQGKTSRGVSVNRHGHTVPRVKAECKNCGSLSITSGDWGFRGAEDNKRLKQCAAYEQDAVDLSIGNPLTFNDKLASDYAAPRFNSQEGYFGSQMKNRFRILSGKRWFYNKTPLELELAIAVSIQHALSIELHKRRAELTASPPPLVAAA